MGLALFRLQLLLEPAVLLQPLAQGVLLDPLLDPLRAERPRLALLEAGGVGPLERLVDGRWGRVAQMVGEDGAGQLSGARAAIAPTELHRVAGIVGQRE